MFIVRSFITTLVFVYCGCLHAQQVMHAAKPIINGGKFGGSFIDALDVTGNPALNPLINDVEAGIHIEKRFLLPELSMFIVAGCIPVNNDGFSVVAKFFGNASYRERTFAVAYGKSLGIIDAGVSIGYFDLHVDRSKKFSSIQTVVASVIRLSEGVYFGSSVTNPRFFMNEQNNLRLASAYSFGMGWQPSSIAYTSIDVVKEENLRVDINLLLQYIFTPHFTFGLSWSVASNQPSVSFSWQRSKVQMQTGAAYHPVLGASPFARCLLRKKSEEQVNE